MSSPRHEKSPATLPDDPTPALSRRQAIQGLGAIALTGSVFGVGCEASDGHQC